MYKVFYKNCLSVYKYFFNFVLCPLIKLVLFGIREKSLCNVYACIKGIGDKSPFSQLNVI